MANSKAAGKGAIDFSTLAGIALALLGIVGGLLLEGGSLSDITSVTAAMIVIAGTAGAVMITTPLHQLIAAAKKLTAVFLDRSPSNADAISQILQFARHARKSGLVSLDPEIEKLTDPFLRKALALAVDGADLQEIRQIMELEIELAEHRGEAEAKVFETAGGYSPTIGIIGAVLGLIQVMKHLEDIQLVGHGIAVAFVATVYGVAFANLFLLPAAAKLRGRLEARLRNHELVLEGVLSLAEGMNPMLIQSKLEAYREAAAEDRDAASGSSSRVEERSGGLARGMARRKTKGHQNSERWLISYADLLTLLFAFFVVLFASTRSDRSRARQISQAVEKAFRGSSLSPRVTSMLGGSATEKAKEVVKGKLKSDRPAAFPIEKPPLQLDLTSAIQNLRSTLQSEMEEGQVQIHMEARGAVISLNSQAVFPSGGDSIAPAVLPLLEKVSVTLNGLPNPIRLEGHTDSLPIRNGRFHSNWELSAARSIAMLRILNERFGVAHERMAIVGYADTNAIGDNLTEAGRTKNRRVDLVILSDFGKQAEPPKGSGI